MRTRGTISRPTAISDQARNCSECVWAEVLVDISTVNIPGPFHRERWSIRCYLDAVDTDRNHVCDMRGSTWDQYWEVAKGNTSAHELAEMLQVKLETYREVPP